MRSIFRLTSQSVAVARSVARWWVVSAFAVVLTLALATGARAATLPGGFQDTAVFSGLDHPTAVRFSPDGRVFVAQKNGIVKVFSSLVGDDGHDVRGPPHPSRRLLGSWPARAWRSTRSSRPGRTSTSCTPTTRRSGATAPVWNDACSDPTGNGCVISGRLSRLTASGDVSVGAEQQLVRDWCQQYPSHSIGSLNFGPDGYLYASGGDGASFNWADWGQQVGNLSPTQTGQANVCGDPDQRGRGAARPGPQDNVRSDRAQRRHPADRPGHRRRRPRDQPGRRRQRRADRGRRPAQPVPLHLPARHQRAVDRRRGLGRMGGDRSPRHATSFTNFGWPCYEARQQSGYSSLGLCQGLYAAGRNAVTAPYYTYSHGAQVVSGEACPTANGSAITGLAFGTSATTYPSPYNTALFFADHSRNCIWAMLQGADGLPDPTSRRTFESAAANPVDLQIGPGGDLYYVDMEGGTIRRISWSVNRAPIGKASASPTGGPAPLTVQFDATGSTDPDGDPMTYSWDLDGNGTYGDSTSATPSYTYTQNGQYNVGLRVSETGEASAPTR